MRQPVTSGIMLIMVVAMTATMAMLSGCTLMPLKRFQPVVAPPAPCEKAQFTFLPSERSEGKPLGFHYVLPSGASKTNAMSFKEYRSETQAAVRAKLPPGLQEHKVTKAITDFVTSVVGGAQLDAQIADGTLDTTKDSEQIAAEREAMRKYSGPSKLKHGEMKDFADKLFDLQLRTSALSFTRGPLSEKGLSPKQVEFLRSLTLDKAFVEYLKAYYKGNFVDRMGTRLDKPQISSTVPDSEIVAAETVLLEFIFDLADNTPVMGDADDESKANTFYPGGTGDKPTALTTELAKYIKIPAGSPTACGITTQNYWVLRDLANAASGQAAAVGGLVANTPGGISIGLGVLGKISIGDNQTLSVMVKTAASRLALRVTLASSYWTLRHVKFNVSEP